MNFDFSDEQLAIREAASDLLAARGASEDLWGEVSELGWPGIAVGEEFGGLGLGVVELTILIEELGYACAPTPMLGTTLAALVIEATASSEQARRLLPGLASGETVGALARVDAPSLVPDAAPDRLLVLADRERGTASVFERNAVDAVEALDPRRRHGRVLTAPTGGEALSEGTEAALDCAAIVVAAELVGLCRKALDLTVAYVKDRHQFGVPVGSFQAVQHAAAQMLRDTEAASVATSFAAWIADSEPEVLPQAAALAKALAADAGRSVTAAAIQLHGGIGFTWEADLHWLFKRAQVDAVYLGSGAEHRAVLARGMKAQVLDRATV